MEEAILRHLIINNYWIDERTMLLKTKKLYYNDPFLSKCKAIVLAVSEKGIVTDRTIAFPEGGGQEGDKGVLRFSDHNSLSSSVQILDTQKGLGRVIYFDDFPTIQVDTPIYHVVAKECLNNFRVDMKLIIEIDITRRAKLTINHSGLHLVLMGIEKFRPGISRAIKGCHITPEYARIDFFTSDKFCVDELQKINQHINELIEQDEVISVFPHSKEPEAWYWKCQNQIIPCGGTHLLSTKYIGRVNLRRKNLGKNMERINVDFLSPQLFLEAYREESKLYD